jgi:hypothetical protein
VLFQPLKNLWTDEVETRIEDQASSNRHHNLFALETCGRHYDPPHGDEYRSRLISLYDWLQREALFELNHGSSLARPQTRAANFSLEVSRFAVAWQISGRWGESSICSESSSTQTRVSGYVEDLDWISLCYVLAPIGWYLWSKKSSCWSTLLDVHLARLQRNLATRARTHRTDDLALYLHKGSRVPRNSVLHESSPCPFVSKLFFLIHLSSHSDSIRIFVSIVLLIVDTTTDRPFIHCSQPQWGWSLNSPFLNILMFGLF